MPPSLRIRQKWTAIRTAVTNGTAITCRTYQRISVLSLIAAISVVTCRFGCAGELVHATKSHHHQGVGRIGDGLEVTGWAVMDDLPEALEVPDRRYALGVQWHPEADEASQMVSGLVDAAAAVRAEQMADSTT